MITKLADPRGYEIDTWDVYVDEAMTVPAGLPATTPCATPTMICRLFSVLVGYQWQTVHLRTDESVAADAVFGADDEAIQCGSLLVLDDRGRQRIASRFHERAADSSGGPPFQVMA